MGKLSEERKVWLLEKNSLEEGVDILTDEVAPTEYESEDTKDLKTRAEQVACFQLEMDDAQAASEGSFKIALKQLHFLNPGSSLIPPRWGLITMWSSERSWFPTTSRSSLHSPRGDPLSYRPLSRKILKDDC